MILARGPNWLSHAVAREVTEAVGPARRPHRLGLPHNQLALGLRSGRSVVSRADRGVGDQRYSPWSPLPTRTTPWSRQGAAESPAGSGRAITRLPAHARFAPRSLVLDLADQVSTHLRKGMIKVALVGGGDEVRPSR
jgi:hypothetical protein